METHDIPDIDLWIASLLVFDDADYLGLCKVSVDRKVLACNHAFARILGRDVHSVVGMDVLDFGDPQETGHTVRRFEGAFEHPKDRVSCVKHYLRPDGTRVTCHIETKLLRDEFNDEPFYITAAWEVPQAAKDEGEVRSLREELNRFADLADTLEKNAVRQPSIQIDASQRSNSPTADNGSTLQNSINLPPALLVVVGFGLLLGFFIFIAIIALIVYEIINGRANNATVGLSIIACGLTALIRLLASLYS